MQFDNRLGVRDARAHFDKNRRIELFGQLEGKLRESTGFSRVGRLKHGNLRRDGVMAAVLFVLGRMHPRVVGNRDHHAGVHAGVRHGIERVRGNVQANVLLRAEGTSACQRSAERGFHGNLFIGSPFTVNFIIFGSFLRDLRAGGAGIAGDKADTCLIQTSRNSFVAEHQLFVGYIFHKRFLLTFMLATARKRRKCPPGHKEQTRESPHHANSIM